MGKSFALRLGRARVLVLLLIAAVVAVGAMVGPLTAPAGATSYPVANVADWDAAVLAIASAGAGPHTITLTGDVTFVNASGAPLNNVNVTIEGNNHLVSCTGVCNRWIDSSFASVITINNVEVSNFSNSAVVLFGGELHVNHSYFHDNVITIAGSRSGAAIAAWGNAGDDPLIYIDSSTFAGNVITTSANGNAHGGAIYVEGSLKVLDSGFYSNYTDSDGGWAKGGAIMVVGATAPDAIPTLTVDGSTFTGNHANTTYGARGGAIELEDVLMPGAVISDSTFDSNSAYGDGGPSFAEGGAVYADNGYALSVVESSFTGNSATFDGGAIKTGNIQAVLWGSTFSYNTANYGGAYMTSAGYSTIGQSLFYQNYALLRGGAVYSQNSKPEYSSSTFTENSAQDGAAIAVEGTTLGQLAHLTIKDNFVVSGAAGGQVYLLNAAIGAASNVIVDSTATNCVLVDGPGTSSLTSAGYNFGDDTSCWANSGTDTADPGFEPNLNSLAFNGGPTQTMLPASFSPIVNAIPPGGSDPCVNTALGAVDQRGMARSYGGGTCDAGAVELLPDLTGTIPTPGGTLKYTIKNAMSLAAPPTVTMGGSLPAGLPTGYAFPYGGIGLNINVFDDGWPVEVQLESPVPTTIFRKYIAGAWQAYEAEAVSTGTGTVWIFRLADGGAGDTDGQANSVIVDPVAIGMAASFTG